MVGAIQVPPVSMEYARGYCVRVSAELIGTACTNEKQNIDKRVDEVDGPDTRSVRVFSW